mmetsp:Transcript_31189/g.74050  ORF Transcript_31189/g.74050 Transcript_31189/m.74050 type:complete len:240 (-) Transcript_31189:471-1190(-)
MSQQSREVLKYSNPEPSPFLDCALCLHNVIAPSAFTRLGVFMQGNLGKLLMSTAFSVESFVRDNSTLPIVSAETVAPIGPWKKYRLILVGGCSGSSWPRCFLHVEYWRPSSGASTNCCTRVPLLCRSSPFSPLVRDARLWTSLPRSENWGPGDSRFVRLAWPERTVAHSESRLRYACFTCCLLRRPFWRAVVSTLERGRFDGGSPRASGPLCPCGGRWMQSLADDSILWSSDSLPPCDG